MIVPTAGPHRRAAPAVLLGLLLAGLFVAVHVRIGATLNDDAWITYRHAANLTTGRGLVYNPGEAVLGTTTPGYALLLSALAEFAGPQRLREISRVLNTLLGLAAAGLAGRAVAAGTRRPLLGALAAGGVLLSPNALFASVAGMESPLFVLLVVVALVELSRGRADGAALAAGLLPLVRPEGALVTAAVGAALLCRSDRAFPRRIRALVPLVAPGVAWGAWAVFRYGSPIPQPVVAKWAGLYPVPTGLTFRRLTSMMGTTFLGRDAMVAGGLGWAMVALLVSALAIGGLWLAWRRPFLAVVPAATLGLFFVYGTSGTLLFEHYVANFEALALLCAWGCLAGAVGWVGRWAPWSSAAEPRPPPGPAPVAWTVAAALLLLPSLLAYPYRSVAAGEPVPGDAIHHGGIDRQAAYRRLAADLMGRLPEGTVVAMPEIGELGFFLPHVRVLDTSGLVGREALPFLPVPPAQRASWDIGAIPPGLVRQERPDLVITLEVFGRHGMLADPWFRSRYTPVLSRTGRWLPWTSTSLMVFSRDDFEVGLALADG